MDSLVSTEWLAQHLGETDLVVVDLNDVTTVKKENILYKCGWSPFEGRSFPAAITHTFVNGHLVYGNGEWNESQKGQRLKFER